MDKNTRLARQKQRFLKNVDGVSDKNLCWLYKRQPKERYPRVWYDDKIQSAHRVAWILQNGQIPDGMYICHKCDNTRCCNPHHLFLGTPADNSHDMAKKGRSASGSNNGWSKLTEPEVINIRKQYAEGGISYRTLADEHGVSKTTIYQIVKRIWWKHV